MPEDLAQYSTTVGRSDFDCSRMLCYSTLCRSEFSEMFDQEPGSGAGVVGLMRRAFHQVWLECSFPWTPIFYDSGPAIARGHGYILVRCFCGCQRDPGLPAVSCGARRGWDVYKVLPRSNSCRDMIVRSIRSSQAS